MEEEFYAFLASLSDNEWQRKVDDKWTVIDIVAHLVGWKKECAKQIPIIWQTKNEPWFIQTNNWDKFNEQSISALQSYTPQRLLEAWSQYDDAIDEAVAQIGEDQMKQYPKLFGWYFEGTDFDETGFDHYTEHYNQLKKILDR